MSLDKLASKEQHMTPIETIIQATMLSAEEIKQL